jgi:hypothetical protein
MGLARLSKVEIGIVAFIISEKLIKFIDCSIFKVRSAIGSRMVLIAILAKSAFHKVYTKKYIILICYNER